MTRTISAFTHLIQAEQNVYALFNSLWLRVIFIDASLAPLASAIIGGTSAEDALKALPVGSVLAGQKLVDQMTDEMFFDPDQDSTKLAEIRDSIEHAEISILYLVLTNECNLACSYCYLSDALWQGSRRSMDVETIRAAIDMFRRIVQRDKVRFPQIVFYGGEPTLRPDLLRYAITYASSTIPGCALTLNTNGTNVDDATVRILREYDVAVGLSIDGPREIHDKHRVDRGGGPTFSRAVEGYLRLLEGGVNVGISCTITSENVRSLTNVTKWLLEELRVPSLGFNLMIGRFPDEASEQEYAQNAAKALIDCFRIAREAGVYEDRMMRRVNSLADGQVSLNDCGGCGQQVVVTPDARVTVCQAFMNTGQNLLLLQDMDDPGGHSLWRKWKRRSPFNIPECLKCEALGMCGGGCPYNSLIRRGDIMAADSTHCIHAKESLRFLLGDLWRLSAGALSQDLLEE